MRRLLLVLVFAALGAVGTAGSTPADASPDAPAEVVVTPAAVLPPAEDICEWNAAVLGFSSSWGVTGHRWYASGYGQAVWCEMTTYYYGYPTRRCFSVSIYGPVTLFPQIAPNGQSGCAYWNPF